MLTNEEMEQRHREEDYQFIAAQSQAKREYDALYEKYYKSGQQITNDQRAEVRKAFAQFDSRYGEKQEKEMLARHLREREEYNAEAYKKWTKLEEKRSELINKYFGKDEVPKELWDKYKEEVREYDAEWGANGKQMTAMLEEQQWELSDYQKAKLEHYEKTKLSPYQQTIRTHMRERIEFNGKVADNWRQVEAFREELVKDYKDWNNVPDYMKDAHKRNKQEFERVWGEDGLHKQEMRKRHHKEIQAQMRMETEKYRNPEKQKDRDREKE